MAAEDDHEQIETNFFGVVNVTRVAPPVFRTQRDGHIFQISSIGGRGATPGLSAYQSAKSAVGGFSEVLAKEAGPLGIKVTVVEPGGMRTDWAGRALGAMTFGDDWGWGSPTDKAQKSMRPTTRQVETSSTQRTSTPTARAKDSWESSFMAILRPSF
jgi:NAD(P)-dependent dehydrogenase (short-subunit alcohol dehydrogenase family)